MLFLVIGRDGTDEQALERRLKARSDHIALGDTLVAAGSMWYGAAILNDEGTMVGSMLVMNFPNRKELNDWLKIEPYVTGKVWKHIDITRCNVNNPWQFSHDKQWFQEYRGEQ